MKPSLMACLGAVALLGSSVPAHSTLITFATTLSGAAESPPVVSTGTGSAEVTYDSVLRTLRVQIEFSDLVGLTTVAHIHAPTAVAGVGTVGVATYPGTFPGFPVGVSSDVFDVTLDLSQETSYTGGFFAAHGATTESAEAGLLAAMLEGKAYVNVHSDYAPSGEIRGFLAKVPDGGSTALLLGSASAALWVCRRRPRSFTRLA